MKKNDWILLVSVLLYSFLFYQQYDGLNFLLFNLVVIGGLYFFDKIKLSRKWYLVAAGCLFSSLCIAIYSSPLAIVANLISLAILSSISLNPAGSVIVALLLAFISLGTSIVYMFLDWIKRGNGETKKSRPLYVTILMIVVIFFITLLFFFMYQSSNPLFKDFTKNINLDFISWPWVFFTLGGLILMYAYYYNRNIELLTLDDNSQSNELSEEKVNQQNWLNDLIKRDTEYTSGVILLSILNLMLLLLNALDLHYLWFDGTLPEHVDHKEFVHNGVGTLITSIILAILIILYYFRGRLNYDPRNKYLRMMACAWIIQNAFMIFSTAFRTNMYVAEFGISYKKIGVFVYLLLTLIGLITTWIKVTKLKTNWYMFRTNPWIWYGLLVFSAVFNWDVIITNFNINKAFKENKKLEKYYLADLSFKNIPQLLLLPDTIKQADDFSVRDYYSSLKGTYFYSFKSGLHNKIYRFLNEVEQSDWRSSCYEKSRVYNALIEMQGQVRSLELDHCYLVRSLVPLKIFQSLEELNVNGNYFRSLEELSLFPALRSVKLVSNRIDTLDKLPKLPGLKEIDLGNNSLLDMKALRNLPNIEVLGLSATGMTSLNVLPEFNELRSLDISLNVIRDFSKLRNYPKLKTLNINNTFSGNLGSFPILTKLEELSVSNNNLQGIEINNFFLNLAKTDQLKKLDLSSNGIIRPYFLTDLIVKNKAVDSLRSLFPSLEILDLSTNAMVTVVTLEKHKNLEELNISYNKLKDVSNIFQLKELRKLNFRGNLVETIDGIRSLKNLEELDLSACIIKSGLPEIAELKKLRILSASGCGITGLKLFFEMNSLRILDLSQNSINEIAGIEKMQSLEELNLSGNVLKDLTPLYKLQNLKTLRIDYPGRENFLKLKKALPDCVIFDTYGSEERRD
jgi:Leucine-rich repeat (LRR) protein